jgi:Txe/YoeB family toxin of toxin-antitoxin system
MGIYFCQLSRMQQAKETRSAKRSFIAFWLIKEIMRDPYRGIGKPEPLKHAFQGYWSRRINAEHRIAYRVVKGDLWIAQLRYYY